MPKARPDEKAVEADSALLAATKRRAPAAVEESVGGGAVVEGDGAAEGERADVAAGEGSEAKETEIVDGIDNDVGLQVTEEEQPIVDEFLAEAREIAPDMSERGLIKFIVGRKMRKDFALKTLRKFVEAMEKYSVYDVPVDRTLEELATTKMWFCGHDALGRAVLWWDAWKHLPADFSTSESLATVLYLINKAMSSWRGMRHGVVFVSNMKDMGWKNFSPEAEKVFMDVLAKRLPVRMRAMYMYNTPFVFKAMMTLLWPFIPSKLKKRIFDLSEEEVLSRFPAMTWDTRVPVASAIESGELKMWD
eukprot:PLAT14608.1.p1 GENE.PLAT14608.1~~PLAT14608.1.p1  ORF type:complete len:305 (-),score=131.12 PLAT14608.1:102-1016(-)